MADPLASSGFKMHGAADNSHFRHPSKVQRLTIIHRKVVGAAEEDTQECLDGQSGQRHTNAPVAAFSKPKMARDVLPVNDKLVRIWKLLRVSVRRRVGQGDWLIGNHFLVFD